MRGIPLHHHPNAHVKFSKSTQWCIQLGYVNKDKIENENL